MSTHDVPPNAQNTPSVKRPSPVDLCRASGHIGWSRQPQAPSTDTCRRCGTIRTVAANGDRTYTYPSASVATTLISVNTERLYATTDAGIWAEEFAKVCPDVDEGLMIGWFANAIETAKAQQRDRSLLDDIQAAEADLAAGNTVDVRAATDEAWTDVDYEAWAEFLASWVDYHHGKGISDQAWAAFQAGKGPYDD